MRCLNEFRKGHHSRQLFELVHDDCEARPEELLQLLPSSGIAIFDTPIGRFQRLTSVDAVLGRIEEDRERGRHEREDQCMKHEHRECSCIQHVSRETNVEYDEFDQTARDF